MAAKNGDIYAAIRKADDTFEATFGRGDSAGLAELYTTEGSVLPTGSDSIKGKPAIATFWQGAMDMGIKDAKIEIVELENHGDTIIEVSQYVLSGADGQMMDRGKFIVIWKQEGGQWKLHRDIFNSSLPPQG